jgi:hypothetical protein
MFHADKPQFVQQADDINENMAVKSENEPDQPPWFNRTLFPTMPVTDQW